MSLSEAVFIPSRFKFEIDFQDLYKFQVQAAKYDPLIKAILRTYGGVFDFYVPINEFEFAKKLGVPYETIVQMLEGLEKQQVGSYLKSTDKPQLTFLQPRVDYKNLFIDAEFIRERKDVKEEQIKAIYHFLDTKECRSNAILEYFGERNTKPCGECDLCLKRKHVEGIDAKIEQEIRVLLLEKPISLHELIDALTVGDDAKKLAVLRELVDEGKVSLLTDNYHWKAN